MICTLANTPGAARNHQNSVYNAANCCKEWTVSAHDLVTESCQWPSSTVDSESVYRVTLTGWPRRPDETKGPAMSIRVRCDCGKEYSVKDELAGKKLRCKACGAGVAIRPAKNAVAATNSRPRSKVASPDDEFDDLDFAAFGSSASPGLPPRRTSTKAAAAPPPASSGASTSTGGGSLEERIAARTEEEVEANTRAAPWKELLSAMIFFAIGAGAFYYLDAREQAGGVVRLPRILAVVYLTIGKYGVLAICWGISLLSFLAAALAFGGFIRIDHSDDE